MLAASFSKVVLMSSPMVLVADEDVAAVSDCGEWMAAGGGETTAGAGEGDRADEDRRDRDTMLSRTSVPRVAGPRLRSS
jgi:hypothetical protein